MKIWPLLTFVKPNQKFYEVYGSTYKLNSVCQVKNYRGYEQVVAVPRVEEHIIYGQFGHFFAIKDHFDPVIVVKRQDAGELV